MDMDERYTRTQNYSGNDRCSRCGDDGQIVVSLRRFPRQLDLATNKLKPEGGLLEEMGPCPDCERGFRLEWGIGVLKDKSQPPKVLDRWDVRGGPWGPEGYWRGRDPDELA
jgi:hypothetical protein